MLRGAADGRQDDAGDGQADEEEPARVGEGRGRRRERPRVMAAGRPDDAEHAAGRRPGRALGPPQLPLGQAALLVAALREQHQADGQGAADEEALRAGVGARGRPGSC